jgi:cell division transport system ATP-binding protein
VGHRGVVSNGAHATDHDAVAAAEKPATDGTAGPRPGTNGHSKPRPPDQPAVPAPAVRISHVSKSFGRTAVFADINFSVAQGELVEITGPSGAGKTTLLRLIHGQLRPNKGQVWVEGRGLHRRWRRGLGRTRREVAFIYQEQRLLPRLNALENLVYALTLVDPSVPSGRIRKRALEALEALGLAGRKKAYPNQLSAGERQRVAVARALASRPRVVLADEPLSAIDQTNAQVVKRLLEEAAAGGTTVIVATHEPTFKAGRVLRLPAGQVLVNRARLAEANGGAPALWRRLRPQNGNHANVHNGRNGHGPNGHGPKTRARKSTDHLPVWRRGVALIANSFRLVGLGGLRSWRRDLRTTAPALGSMALLLLLAGIVAMVGLSVANVAAYEASQASVVRIYLAPDATTDAVSALQTRLAADPRVASVTYVSQDQALQEAQSHPGLASLGSLSASNPFPASLDVTARSVNQVGAIAALATGDPAVDPTYPTSYDPDMYSRLRHIALVLGGIAGGLLLIFAVVAYVVSANSIRGVAAARKDEVTITRLLGARGWMLRGPFMVEGLMTGALAGAVAGAVTGGVWLLSSRFAAATFAQVLPGVGLNSMRYVVAAIILAGLLLGGFTATMGFRRYRA